MEERTETARSGKHSFYSVGAIATCSKKADALLSWRLFSRKTINVCEKALQTTSLYLTLSY